MWKPLHRSMALTSFQCTFLETLSQHLFHFSKQTSKFPFEMTISSFVTFCLTSSLVFHQELLTLHRETHLDCNVRADRSGWCNGLVENSAGDVENLMSLSRQAHIVTSHCWLSNLQEWVSVHACANKVHFD